MRGDETRSSYVRCVQGNQPNIPARTTCRHGLYNSMVHAHLCYSYCTDQRTSYLCMDPVSPPPILEVFCCTTNEYSHLQRSPMSFIETLLQLSILSGKRSISRMKCRVIWMGYYFPALEKIKKLKSTVARFLVWQPVLNTAPTSQLGGGRHCFWGCITPIYRTELMF